MRQPEPSYAMRNILWPMRREWRITYGVNVPASYHVTYYFDSCSSHWLGSVELCWPCFHNIICILLLNIVARCEAQCTLHEMLKHWTSSIKDKLEIVRAIEKGMKNSAQHVKRTLRWAQFALLLHPQWPLLFRTRTTFVVCGKQVRRLRKGECFRCEFHHLRRRERHCWYKCRSEWGFQQNGHVKMFLWKCRGGARHQGCAPFNIFRHTVSNGEMPKKLSDRLIVASLVAPLSHIRDNKDEINDIQTSWVPRPTLTDVVCMMNVVTLFVVRCGLVEKLACAWRTYP